MKRILISMICLIMCCSLFVVSVSADTYTSNFMISRLQFSSLRGTHKVTSASQVVSIAKDMTKVGPNFYETSVDLKLFQESLLNYDLVAAFQIYGSFDKNNGVVPDNYVSFNFSLRCTESKPIDFDDALNSQVRLTLPDINTEIRNYVFTKMNDYQYQISFIAPLSGINYDYINSTYFRFYIPIKWIYSATYESDPLLVQIMFDDISITYDSIPITAGDVDIIINDLDSIDTTLNAIKGQLDTLPGDVAAQIKDIELGQDYNKGLDTSEIVAYESALDRVMEEVDVDQVIDIMGDGVSLNQPGMYNDQSFNSVSDLMTNIIDATGIMPLITLTLSIGLACFIIGRSGKL